MTNPPRSLELGEGEQVLRSWTCGIPDSPESSIVKHEGTLVLTTGRIVYEPMRAPRPLTALVGGARQSFRLADVDRVEAPEGRQPRLRLTLLTGEAFTVILSGSRFSVPWSKRKWVALEEALGAIKHEMETAGEAEHRG